MKFDTFISYNTEDKHSVLELAEELHKRNLTVWIDVWEILPGMSWQRALEKAMESSGSSIVCIGPSGIGPWQNQESRALLSETASQNKPIIPVILPGTPATIDMPVFLRSRSYIDFRSGLTEEGIERLIWGITGKRPTALSDKRKEVEVPDEKFVCPTVAELSDVFRTVGLPEFTYVEPRIYKRVALAIRQPGKHVIVEGPSGSGKTCMVFRIMGELGFKESHNYKYLSAAADQNHDVILTTVRNAVTDDKSTITIIDDVHFLPQETRNELAKILKLCSDGVFTRGKPTKFVLIGIPAAASGLLLNVHDLGPRIGIFKMPQATARTEGPYQRRRRATFCHLSTSNRDHQRSK